MIFGMVVFRGGGRIRTQLLAQLLGRRSHFGVCVSRVAGCAGSRYRVCVGAWVRTDDGRFSSLVLKSYFFSFFGGARTNRQQIHPNRSDPPPIPTLTLSVTPTRDRLEGRYPKRTRPQIRTFRTRERSNLLSYIRRTYVWYVTIAVCVLRAVHAGPTGQKGLALKNHSVCSY